MQFEPNDLPDGLRELASSHGLIPLPGAFAAGRHPYPVRTGRMPLISREGLEIDTWPTVPNCRVAMLDMDKKQDREEYLRILNYGSGGYGFELIHIERIFVVKKRVLPDGSVRRRKVRRIYIEYKAPYRVPLHRAED
jgi:hypothetical protein